MVNALFVPTVRDTKWVRETLPWTSPSELPVAGRRIIDYSIECARGRDVMFTEILDWDFSKKLEEDFSEITQSAFLVFYAKGEGPVPNGLADIEGLSTPLTQNVMDGLVVAWGLCVPNCDPSTIRMEPVDDATVANTPSGLYCRHDGKWMRMVPCGTVVDGIKSWHELNFRILHNPGEFSLPGYSAEKGVYLGRNVVLEHGTEVKAPAIIQNDAWCARNVVLDGDVVIGSGSFIAEGARLCRTVVCDDTFVGGGLELEGKIVSRNRIIDAESGAWTDVDDDGVVSSIGTVSDGVGFLRRLWRGIWHFLYGASRGRRG